MEAATSEAWLGKFPVEWKEAAECFNTWRFLTSRWSNATGGSVSLTAPGLGSLARLGHQSSPCLDPFLFRQAKHLYSKVTPACQASLPAYKNARFRRWWGWWVVEGEVCWGDARFLTFNFHQALEAKLTVKTILTIIRMSDLQTVLPHHPDPTFLLGWRWKWWPKFLCWLYSLSSGDLGGSATLGSRPYDWWGRV